MANERNLVQYSGRTRKEAEELARKGGINSGIARRKKRDMRDSMRAILEMPLNEQQLHQLEMFGLPGKEWNLADLVNIMAVQQSLKGNVRAMEFVRDTSGYSPELQLKEEQFNYEKERKSGQGVEIEDISSIVTKIWGYDSWMRLLNDGIPAQLTQNIKYNFADKHIDYIRKCQDSMYNILEGAIRSGKTVDHVLAFAMELCSSPDKFHLATGSTMANAKLNIGDSNGYGLEHIFRGQCRWTRYKDNDALIIRGPYTSFEEKVVIFAGGGASNSYKKYRGNSYGMWIATEINLHHDNSIKEAFNRTAAAVKRKFFWDLNPEHPKAPIYTEYIDKYIEKDKAGSLKGGLNYQHCTIFDNVNISKQRLEEIVSQYDPGSIWYIRDIEGKRSIAEGLIYSKLATAIAANDNKYLMSKKKAQEACKSGVINRIIIGIDFGGNGSGHAFVAVGETIGYEKLIILRTKRYVEGVIDPETGKITKDIDPHDLGELFLDFTRGILNDYGFITKCYADSAEQVLIRGLKTALISAGMGNIKVVNAMKAKITDRIFATTSLVAMGRLFYTEECKTFMEAASMAVWDPDKLELERLDDGTSDIDTLDAFEYSWERDISKFLKQDDLPRR